MIYTTRNASAYYGYDPLIPDLYVDGPKFTNTGLLNHQGLPLYRTQPPIGFGRDKEW